METKLNSKELVATLVSTLKAEIMPELIDAIMSALADHESEPRKRSGYRGKKSDYEPTPHLVVVREYSDKGIAVYGDLKDNKEALDTIKSFGEDDKHHATFYNRLASIEGTPCGWFIHKTPLESHGGLQSLIKLLKACNLVIKEEASVADVTAANREARKADKTESKKTESKKTESKKTESKKTESKKTESKKTENKKTENKKTESKKTESKKTEAPKATPKAVVVHGLCFEPTRDDYQTKERELIQRGNIYYRVTEKGNTAVYIHAGTGDDAEVYAALTQVKGDISTAVHPGAHVWNEIAQLGIVESVRQGKLKATAALAYAICECGATQENIDFVWGKIA